MQLKVFPLRIQPIIFPYHFTNCFLLSLFKCFFYSSKLYSDINKIIWKWPRGHSFSPRFTTTPNFVIHFQNDIFSWLSCSFIILWIRFPLPKHSERRTNFKVGEESEERHKRDTFTLGGSFTLCKLRRYRSTCSLNATIRLSTGLNC